jgi:GNAT superfamily N-acetyltransferase
MDFMIRPMEPGDREAVARLIFHSTNRYYRSIGRPPIFPGDELSPAVFFDVYQQIDPGQGLVAIDQNTRNLVGSCFVHPREQHVSLGIMNVCPENFGRGIARQLIRRIIADAAGKPVRLVSSCLNLDSYSLYTRAGFVPFCTYQDMLLSVPASGLAHEPPAGVVVRAATPEDVEAMAALEAEIAGITRRNDYRYFIANPDGLWHVSVIDAAGGGLAGFLVSCRAEACNMLGPGVARTETQAAALLHAELNQQRGRTPVFLVPVHCGELVAQLYRWGARNCELHVGQSCGPAQTPRGVTMPTFLPETG